MSKYETSITLINSSETWDDQVYSVTKFVFATFGFFSMNWVYRYDLPIYIKTLVNVTIPVITTRGYGY